MKRRYRSEGVLVTGRGRGQRWTDSDRSDKGLWYCLVMLMERSLVSHICTKMSATSVLSYK